jgi:hypothetical protein
MVPDWHFWEFRVKVTCHKKKINMGLCCGKLLGVTGFPFWEVSVAGRKWRDLPDAAQPQGQVILEI